MSSEIACCGVSIVGIGIDLVSIPDFAEQVDRPGTVFAETFTPGERRDAADKSSSAARHLAARWAAKEAVIKAWSAFRASSTAPRQSLSDLSSADSLKKAPLW